MEYTSYASETVYESNKMYLHAQSHQRSRIEYFLQDWGILETHAASINEKFITEMSIPVRTLIHCDCTYPQYTEDILTEILHRLDTGKCSRNMQSLHPSWTRAGAVLPIRVWSRLLVSNRTLGTRAIFQIMWSRRYLDYFLRFGYGISASQAVSLRIWIRWKPLQAAQQKMAKMRDNPKQKMRWNLSLKSSNAPRKQRKWTPMTLNRQTK